MTGLLSGGRITAMKRRRIKICCLVAAFFILFAAAVSWRQQRKFLVVENLETGEVYARTSVKAGDELVFEWVHSFEHIPWNEYYEVEQDGGFVLNTISVAGFGAGIPAEMDCTYRYEDGLIYMEDIGSYFPQFNWINSQTALIEIDLNGTLLLKGADMPHHEKIVLSIKRQRWSER